MKSKIINSQISNWKTYLMYKNQMLTLAKNVFEFKNLPESVDVAYMNQKLLINGAVAFFKDDITDDLMCLPFSSETMIPDVYGRPQKINVMGENGFNRWLNKDQFVIMYDNNSMLPIYLDIIQYAQRIALCVRTQDVNIKQQRTPRLWKVPQDKEKSIKNAIDDIDAFADQVATYDSTRLQDIEAVLAPAPFVSDKIDDHLKIIWAEFFRLIGVANLQEQKKERVIRDEMLVSQGGTIASRYARFEPRKRAIEKINKLFGTKIEVSYYDGEPTSKEKGENDVSIDDSDVSLDSESVQITE